MVKKQKVTTAEETASGQNRRDSEGKNARSNLSRTKPSSTPTKGKVGKMTQGTGPGSGVLRTEFNPRPEEKTAGN